MSNLDRLAQARLVDPSQVSTQEKEVIESLTAEEIETVISVKSKLIAAASGKESNFVNSAKPFLF